MRKLNHRPSKRTLQNLKDNQPKSKVPKKLLQNRRSKGTSQITGRNAVKEVLNTIDRSEIIALYIEKESDNDTRIKEILENSAGVRKFFLQKEEFRKLVRDDARGIMLLVKEANIDLNIAKAVLKDTSEFKSVIVLNEVEYEQNLGAIIRSCEALGAKTLVIGNRVKTRITPVVRRVSMGATERINIVNENIFVAISELKRLGFKIYAIETNGEKNIGEIDLKYDRIAFVVGGEDKGVTEPLQNRSDEVVKLPMKGLMGSLNISVSVGIVLYERLRQTLIV